MPQLDAHDRQMLTDLRYHWEGFYKILWNAKAGEFTAERQVQDKKKAKTLTDTTLPALREQMRQDYAEWAPRRPLAEKSST